MERQLPKIRRVVIFGDSLSDIGNMKSRWLSLAPGVHINDFGRFSDGKNWVDFFWEKLGGVMFDGNDVQGTVNHSKCHLSLASANHGGKEGMELVSYAEGGAIGYEYPDGQSWAGFAKATFALDTLKSQLRKYDAERTTNTGACARVPNAETLFIFWIGANDVVTVKRTEEAMDAVASNVFKAAFSLVDRDGVPGSHVVVVDLPNPKHMPKFVQSTTEERRQLKKASKRFNKWFQDIIADKETRDLIVRGCQKTRSTFRIFKISKCMDQDDLQRRGFAPIAQSKDDGVGSRFTNDDGAWEHGVVHDGLHPTQGVYKVIADVMMSYLKAEGFTFGNFGHSNASLSS